MAHTQLMAEARAKAGKGSARAVRRENKVPGVIYGDNKEPVLVKLGEKELTMAYRTGHFFTSICDLNVEGKKHSVFPRDVQFDPVSDRLTHVDFLRVNDKTEINVNIPVHAINADKSVGVGKGGVVTLLLHELAVVCKAGNVPEVIEIDVTNVDVGHSVHVKDIKFPAGAKAEEDKELTVLSIVAPSSMKADDDAAKVEADAAAAAAPAAGAKPAAAPAAPAAKAAK